MANSVAVQNFSRWTPEQDSQLEAMAVNGASTAKIAKELGRTRASIWARKSKLGIDTRLTHSTGTNYPVTVNKKKRKATKKTAVAVPATPPAVAVSGSLNLDNVARVAKKHGVKVTVIQFG